MIPVTKPFLPPSEEYVELINKVFDRNWLTNDGPLVNELEIKLRKLFEADYLYYLSNGTIALQIAIKSLGLTGEIITTPFSYVATTSAIVWENCTPVFVDIDPETLCINTALIEASITEETTGILATHVYGNSCDIDAITDIAERHNLKVIYDAAHCFGSLYRGRSLFTYGDIATTSFHATKLFHTVEGGAVVTSNPVLAEKLKSRRNFGHDGPDAFSSVGINGKNSEFHAAMGLVNLKYVDEILIKRREHSLRYDHWLDKSHLTKPVITEGCTFNYAYYPIIFATEEEAIRVMKALSIQKIYARRYFYPSLATLNYVKARMPLPVVDDIAPRILCLPLYYQMQFSDIDLVCRHILEALNEK